VGISSEGQTIAVGTLSPHLYIFQRGGELLLDHEATREMRMAAVSADGSMVAGGSTGGEILLFRRVPGPAPVIATYASYMIERKVSKHPEEFGKGALQGVAGPESANNSACQAAFIPLFVLGILKE
jgi:putative tricarboxylic transport membrane protein